MQAEAFAPEKLGTLYHDAQTAAPAAALTAEQAYLLDVSGCATVPPPPGPAPRPAHPRGPKRGPACVEIGR